MTLIDADDAAPATEARPGEWWRPRWWELAPEALVALVLLFFLIDETDAATSALTSPKAIGLMALTAVAWVGGRLAVARLGVPVAARMALFALAGAGVLAVVVLPAYDDDTVVETLAGSPTATTEAAPRDDPPDSRAAPMPMKAPALIRSGALDGIDHRAEGKVTLYRHADGRLVVGLEEIDVQPGPDYDVYVAPGADRDDIKGATRLDDLRGNKGSQFYDVPPGVAADEGEWTVLIWCETFDVPIANSTPT